MEEKSQRYIPDGYIKSSGVHCINCNSVSDDKTDSGYIISVIKKLGVKKSNDYFDFKDDLFLTSYTMETFNSLMTKKEHDSYFDAEMNVFSDSQERPIEFNPKEISKIGVE